VTGRRAPCRRRVGGGSGSGGAQLAACGVPPTRSGRRLAPAPPPAAAQRRVAAPLFAWELWVAREVRRGRSKSHSLSSIALPVVFSLPARATMHAPRRTLPVTGATGLQAKCAREEGGRVHACMLACLLATFVRRPEQSGAFSSACLAPEALPPDSVRPAAGAAMLRPLCLPSRSAPHLAPARRASLGVPSILDACTCRLSGRETVVTLVRFVPATGRSTALSGTRTCILVCFRFYRRAQGESEHRRCVIRTSNGFTGPFRGL
jgi:hypothetical protein